MNKFIETATALFLENGIENIKLSQIDSALGQPDGSTFLLYGSKAELLDQCIETLSDHTITECIRILDNSSQNVYSRLLCMMDFLKESSPKLELLCKDKGRNTAFTRNVSPSSAPLYNQLTQALTRLISDGCRQKLFHVANVHQRAAFISYGLLGLRNHCDDESVKYDEFKDCLEALLGISLKDIAACA